MNPELKKKWVEALRSGKYEQGEKQLRSQDDKFCCLGVLADIQGEPWEKNSFGNWEVDGQPYCLSNDTLDKFGLTPSQHDDLAARNDGDNLPKHTFPEIADYIEENL